MAEATKTFAQLMKTDKLIRLNLRKNGPRSYRRGVGELVRVLGEKGELTQRKIVGETGWSRKALKNIVKKAEKKGLVKFIEDENPRTYKVKLTKTGKEIYAKRAAADEAAIRAIFDVLNDEELATLDALTDKLIVAAKEDGKVCAYGKGHKARKCGGRRGRKHCCRKAKK